MSGSGAEVTGAEGLAEISEHKEGGGGRRLLSAVTCQTLREHFHLPLHTVAVKFGMCTTAFKKMCRRLGIAKWPHRQVVFRFVMCFSFHAWLLLQLYQELRVGLFYSSFFILKGREIYEYVCWQNIYIPKCILKNCS